jgi:hypothetical protein
MVALFYAGGDKIGVKSARPGVGRLYLALAWAISSRVAG